MTMASLDGLRVLNTRPQEQAPSLSLSIRAAGGIAIECPTLAIKPNDNAWIHSLPNLHEVQKAIFISPNAVHCSMTQLIKNKISWPSTIHVIAIGQGTADALNEFQIQVHDIPEISDSEHLLNLHSLQHVKNQTVLLFKGEGGRTLIAETLHRRKAHVKSLSVYKRGMPEIRHQFINTLWRDDSIDIILITSAQSIKNLFKMFAQEAHSWLQSKACLVISERLAKEAALLGMKHIIISHPDRMMSTLFDYKD